MEPWMPRPRERVCLQDGLKLDLNRLARQGFIRRGANIGSRGIRWTHSYWGEIATGTISADMSGKDEGWFRIQLGSLDQRIVLGPGRRVAIPGRRGYETSESRGSPAQVKPRFLRLLVLDRGYSQTRTFRGGIT